MVNKVLGQIFLGNSIFNYMITVVLFVAGVMAVRIFEYIILKRFEKWALKTKTTFDDFLVDIVKKDLLPLVYFGIFYLSVNNLALAPLLKKLINVFGAAVIVLTVARLFSEAVSYGFKLYSLKAAKNVALERSLQGILRIIKSIIWGLAFVFFLDNLGFKISAVIAGLGVGGVAVALAAQAVLKDLFSYLSIIFDRPFEVDDFIIVDDYLGSVEHIGMKTTRIRSLSGEQVVFSNTDLTDSRVRNYKRMEKRRVLFRLGVTYQTSLEQLKAIPQLIEQTIKGVKHTIFDRAHFFSYADFSLVFEVVYFVLSSDYNKYMDIQQEINFAIKEEFEKRKIEFAYPTQTIYVNK